MDTLLSVPSLSPEPTPKHHHQLTPTQHAKPPPPPPHMPPSESIEPRLSRIGSRQPEHLPCPRCNSNNTKFCYYNNYNLSQPRHFCKSCRRYWTRGGTLRNVPIGGGTRKSAVTSNKRPCTATTTPATSSTHIIDLSGQTQTRPEPKITNSIVSNPVSGMSSGSVVDMNEAATSCAFESVWWSGQMGVIGGGGLFSLSGYGLGSELINGLGVLDWPMEPVGELNDGGVMVCGENTWPAGGGNECSMVNADNFSWPEIAISTPSKALK